MHETYKIIVRIFNAVGKVKVPNKGEIYFPKEYQVEVLKGRDPVKRSDWVLTWKEARQIAAGYCREYGERTFDVHRITYHNVAL